LKNTGFHTRSCDKRRGASHHTHQLAFPVDSVCHGSDQRDLYGCETGTTTALCSSTPLRIRHPDTNTNHSRDPQPHPSLVCGSLSCPGRPSGSAGCCHFGGCWAPCGPRRLTFALASQSRALDLVYREVDASLSRDFALLRVVNGGKPTQREREREREREFRLIALVGQQKMHKIES